MPLPGFMHRYARTDGRTTRKHYASVQSKQWVNGSYGSWVDALSPMTLLHIYRKHEVKATFVVGDCGGSVNCVERI